jgi:hypothetical protein
VKYIESGVNLPVRIPLTLRHVSNIIVSRHNITQNPSQQFKELRLIGRFPHSKRSRVFDRDFWMGKSGRDFLFVICPVLDDIIQIRIGKCNVENIKCRMPCVQKKGLPAKLVSVMQEVNKGWESTVPPGFLVNCPNTVFDDILVPIIQHIFAQRAYNSRFLNRGCVISYVSPTN